MTDKGRPKKYSSVEEAKKAAKEYQKNYLEVRRRRYKEDSEYRSRCIARERNSYRDSTKGFVPKNFGSNAGQASFFSKKHEGYLTVGEMASFLGVATKRLFVSWIESKRFPKPRNVFQNEEPLYPVNLADKLALILRDGLYNRGAFRSTDIQVISKLHTAVNTT